MPTIAIIAPGNMGAALGRHLVAAGLPVLTSLTGRSASSAERAKAAGLQHADDASIATADIILSVLPPSDALHLAERLRPALAATLRKPVYADCNAVNPQTVKAIAERIASAGCGFVDVGIIGPPPTAPGLRTVLYASGGEASRLAPLAEAGLALRVMAAPVGAASALKMSYAGLTKGLTALGTTMALAAAEAGVDEALTRELLESQPALASWLVRQIPGMLSKAYRWNGEMDEIAGFLRIQDGPARIYEGMADLYTRIARDFAGDKADVGTLATMVARLRLGADGPETSAGPSKIT